MLTKVAQRSAKALFGFEQGCRERDNGLTIKSKFSPSGTSTILCPVSENRASTECKYAKSGCRFASSSTKYPNVALISAVVGIFISWKVLNGEMRIPTRSAPTAATTACATSRGNRARFSTEPPYSSVRMLVLVCKNWSSR